MLLPMSWQLTAVLVLVGCAFPCILSQEANKLSSKLQSKDSISSVDKPLAHAFQEKGESSTSEENKKPRLNDDSGEDVEELSGEDEPSQSLGVSLDDPSTKDMQSEAYNFDKREAEGLDAFEKRRLDSISGNSAFQGFGKRRLDSIGGNSAFQGFGKRRLDSIDGNSAFQGFGKRRLDSIGGSSAFQGFGKRRLDSIGGSSAFHGFGKRRLDSISGSSAFQGFGKRRLDSIGGNNAFQGFGKRRLDSIGGSGAFQGFGKRRLDSIGGSGAFQGFGKRRLDSISGNSAFQGFGKRRLDSIGGNSAFQGFGKRRLDSIGGSSAFQGFGKRRLDSISGNSAFQDFGKRRLDSISGNSAFRGFGKRRLDSISGNSAFQGFGKRDVNHQQLFSDGPTETDAKSLSRRKRETNDNISAMVKRSTSHEGDLTLSLTSVKDAERPAVHKRSAIPRDWDIYLDEAYNRDNTDDVVDSDFDTVDKRRFDRISNNVHGFNSFGKRRLDRIGQNSAFRGFGKRHLDSIAGSSPFSRAFGKRRFDSISDYSRFSTRTFGKRRFDSIAGRSSFWTFGKRSDDSPDRLAKRTLDRIGPSSAFKGFGKRHKYLTDQPAPELLLPAYWQSPSSSSSSSPSSLEQKSSEYLKSLLEQSSAYAPVHNHRLGSHDLSDYTSPVQKRRFDSIERFNLFRRFGRGGSPATRNHPHSQKELSDDTEVISGEKNLDPQNMLDTDYPELAKALSTDQERISESDFELALLELIELISEVSDQ
ncbi:pedal peptide protein [Plakobranchus ocellatus]|uniref:Pedal peptide protein n=1 Tax=Plakobranchus ocellatus TaxID=259542 RepID=A0AAV4CVP7_9GAST|nr:pedal peptide protein [Plakobranchus ocellatus]